MKKKIIGIFALLIITTQNVNLWGIEESLKNNPLKGTVELIAASVDKITTSLLGIDEKDIQNLQATIAKIFTEKIEVSQRIEALPFVVSILNEKIFDSEAITSLNENEKLKIFIGLEDFWRQLCDFLNKMETIKEPGYKEVLIKINESIEAIINAINDKDATQTLNECFSKFRYINWILENLNPIALAKVKNFDDLNKSLEPVKASTNPIAALLQKFAIDNFLTNENILNLNENEKKTYFTFMQHLLLAFLDDDDEKKYENYLALSDEAENNKKILEKIKNQKNESLYSLYQIAKENLASKVSGKKEETAKEKTPKKPEKSPVDVEEAFMRLSIELTALATQIKA